MGDALQTIKVFPFSIHAEGNLWIFYMYSLSRCYIENVNIYCLLSLMDLENSHLVSGPRLLHYITINTSSNFSTNLSQLQKLRDMYCNSYTWLHYTTHAFWLRTYHIRIQTWVLYIMQQPPVYHSHIHTLYSKCIMNLVNVGSWWFSSRTGFGSVSV